jgi:hypothetical protein
MNGRLLPKAHCDYCSKQSARAGRARACFRPLTRDRHLTNALLMGSIASEDERNGAAATGELFPQRRRGFRAATDDISPALSSGSFVTANLWHGRKIKLCESSELCNFVICKCDSLARVSAHLRQLYCVAFLSTALFSVFECLVLPRGTMRCGSSFNPEGSACTTVLSSLF